MRSLLFGQTERKLDPLSSSVCGSCIPITGPNGWPRLKQSQSAEKGLLLSFGHPEYDASNENGKRQKQRLCNPNAFSIWIDWSGLGIQRFS